MRAWQIAEFVGPEGLSLVDRPDPAPGPRDVVVAVRAVSLNYRDLVVVKGGYRRTEPGLVPCSDAAGEVVAVGGAVTTVAVGDRVTSTFMPLWQSGRLRSEAARRALGAGSTPGVLATTVVLDENAVVPVPPHLSFDEASALPCAALTAWHALFEEGALPDDATVLTLGTGGVSIAALQLARNAGARVIATSSDDGKIARLKALGVDDTINYREVEDWGDRARDLTGGAGVDHVIEVGGQGTLAQSIRAVRTGGTISLIGVLARSLPVNLAPLFLRNIRLQGVLVGSREMFLRMHTAIVAAGIRPVIDRVFPFEQAPEAFAHLASGRHFGKVVVSTSGDARG
jgi:NADPH:quinone reductase-like Zn-dependent oxidoreductase